MNIILKPQPNDRKNINATCRKMMRAFGHIVATCWDMLGVFGSSLNGQMCANNTQHVATGWLNARQILRLTMLRYIALKCWDRLAYVSSLDRLSCPRNWLSLDPPRISVWNIFTNNVRGLALKTGPTGGTNSFNSTSSPEAEGYLYFMIYNFIEV